jgi:hypothetical protein
VRRFALVGIALLFVAGCGSADERTGVPASSGEENVPVETSAPVDESKLQPPRILLLNSVGEQQKAVRGSFCVEYVDATSGQASGMCGDSPAIHPDAITVALPGEELTFVFSGAEIVRPDSCHSDDEQGCIGSIHVRPLGCEDREVERVPLARGPETRWTIDLERGAYELDVFGYFETSEGATGDVSGALGLLVGGGPKKYDALGVTGIKPAMQVCPFGD